ncbi:hypothetical protein HanIR_Chr06g0278511 [Helianthus annuus]|nr:hypothetical protein HanIR_Chr06g0278511 [Helianthus annuus]
MTEYKEDEEIFEIVKTVLLLLRLCRFAKGVVVCHSSSLSLYL